jgi:peptidoglycan/LPS O-acetylase OafA/YrhL
VGAAYTLVLWSVSRSDVSIPFAGFHKWAAGFSYTMYLVHFPIFLFLGAAANQFLGWPILSSPSWVVCGRVLAIICALYGIGYLFYLATETHTDRVRGILKKGALKLMPLAVRAD